MSYCYIITIEPDKLGGGKPCICCMWITVYDVLGWLATGNVFKFAEIIDGLSRTGTETDIKMSVWEFGLPYSDFVQFV